MLPHKAELVFDKGMISDMYSHDGSLLLRDKVGVPREKLS
jgi:hypothetical protein